MELVSKVTGIRSLLALRRSLSDLSVRWLLVAASLAAAGLLLAFVSSRSRSARGVNVG